MQDKFDLKQNPSGVDKMLQDNVEGQWVASPIGCIKNTRNLKIQERRVC